MAYSPLMVQPMRDEVTRLGVEELRTPEAVDAFLAAADGPALVFVNSVCGCAAGNARPALFLATRNPRCPARRATVFAGQDPEATSRLREHFGAVAPSSPSFYVLDGGELKGHVPRSGIEGHSAEQVAAQLDRLFDTRADAATG
ncbi:MAG: BrxA/BrxB family bacilliredoxin [Candidatus Krumholzibacteriia bacterium]